VLSLGCTSTGHDGYTPSSRHSPRTSRRSTWVMYTNSLVVPQGITPCPWGRTKHRSSPTVSSSTPSSLVSGVIRAGLTPPGR